MTKSNALQNVESSLPAKSTEQRREDTSVFGPVELEETIISSTVTEEF